MRKLNISDGLLRDMTDKDRLIGRIVEIEWGMFDEVENVGGRAGCQDDVDTFYVMRYSHFNGFSEETLRSYLEDLDKALLQGRNLITEKYAYMMEFTDKEYFDKNLKPYIPEISDEKERLVEEITGIFTGYEEEFSKQYPDFASKGRPIHDLEGGMVSSSIYLTGELKTYSMTTLNCCLKDAKSISADGETVVYRIHKKTAEFYGYENLV